MFFLLILLYLCFFIFAFYLSQEPAPAFQQAAKRLPSAGTEARPTKGTGSGANFKYFALCSMLFALCSLPTGF
jgi:hypothetical protein